MRLHRANYRWTTFLFVAFKLFDVVDSLACYSCVALNYRQNVLSRNDALFPPQSRENLSALFDALSENNVGHVEVSSSCADVTLTSQPSFLNTPIAICGRNDKCVKMDFYYSGEKVVLRNCLSNLMETVNAPKFKHHCPMSSEDKSELVVGQLKNVSVCSCQNRRNGDYLNSSFMVHWRRTAFVYKCEFGFSLLILICGCAELIVYDCYSIFLLMLIASFVFILLYLEFYFGSVYNCAALLHLHTLSAGFLAFICWLSCLVPIFYGEAVYVAGRAVTHVIYKFYGCQIIFGSLLASFAAASFARRKEIKAVELAHLDYMKKLLKTTMHVAADVQKEAKQFNLKPRDIHSFS
ncbi:unnamed protein product [Caenorhabditis sp. 36 PRJEB53466]|nr:unnamed protein product [Caenorhabditis sp. 36 PRJEB53466]